MLRPYPLAHYHPVSFCSRCFQSLTLHLSWGNSMGERGPHILGVWERKGTSAQSSHKWNLSEGPITLLSCLISALPWQGFLRITVDS